MEKKSFANLQILQGLFTNETFCLGVSAALAYATRESPGSVSHTLSSNKHISLNGTWTKAFHCKQQRIPQPSINSAKIITI